MQPNQSTTETEAGRTAALVGTGDLFGVWVPVSERMPKDRQRVLVAHLNGIHVWRAIATYWPAGTMDASNWDDPPDDWWDEDGNRCVCPDAGWWEECFEVEGASMLGNVTHWMPLPPSPNNEQHEQNERRN